jgi:hypothetical protein
LSVIGSRIAAVAYRHRLSDDDHDRLRSLIKRRVHRSYLSFDHVVGMAERCGDIRAFMEWLEKSNVRTTRAARAGARRRLG